MKEYKISVNPRILELLGPNLYTNIYYVLAELIANAYDADAHNVYIIANMDDIRVEDDGHGMSYDNTSVRDKLFVECKFYSPCVGTQEPIRSCDMDGCMMQTFPF